MTTYKEALEYTKGRRPVRHDISGIITAGVVTQQVNEAYTDALEYGISCPEEIQQLVFERVMGALLALQAGYTALMYYGHSITDQLQEALEQSEDTLREELLRSLGIPS